MHGAHPVFDNAVLGYRQREVQSCAAAVVVIVLTLVVVVVVVVFVLLAPVLAFVLVYKLLESVVLMLNHPF